MGSWQSFCEFHSFANVLAHILVVSHQNFDTGLLGFGSHGFQFSHSGCTRLFKVDALASISDGFAQKLRIVSSTSRDQSKTRSFRRRKIGKRCGKLHTVFGFGFGLPFLEFFTAGSLTASTHEPRFHNVIKRSGRTVFLKHLNGMVPSHTTVRSTASNQDDFGLSLFGVHGKRTSKGTSRTSRHFVGDKCTGASGRKGRGTLSKYRERHGKGGSNCLLWDLHEI
mmetsp:Transcript_1538/g.1928  ORF Transcript_1538/g.1928 Transcript_1538/m.1928 type:complete len:224 (-) Transcript_1538:111-782(-)